MEATRGPVNFEREGDHKLITDGDMTNKHMTKNIVTVTAQHKTSNQTIKNGNV